MFGCFRCAPELAVSPCRAAGRFRGGAGTRTPGGRGAGGGWREPAERLGRGWGEIVRQLSIFCPPPFSRFRMWALSCLCLPFPKAVVNLTAPWPGQSFHRLLFPFRNRDVLRQVRKKPPQRFRIRMHRRTIEELPFRGPLLPHRHPECRAFDPPVFHLHD